MVAQNYTDPSLESYDHSRAHPEDKTGNEVANLILHPEEKMYLEVRGLRFFRKRDGLPEAYILLGPRSENLTDGELQVVRKPGSFMLHYSHWHPSNKTTSLDRLTRRVEL